MEDMRVGVVSGYEVIYRQQDVCCWVVGRMYDIRIEDKMLGDIRIFDKLILYKRI